MRVLFFGTGDMSYMRNRIIADGLRAAEVEVIECVVPLWRGTSDRVVVASGRWMRPGFLKRALCTYAQLVGQYRRLAVEYDVMWVGYPGQVDVYLARLLTWLARKPLVLDLLMSLYLISTERGLHLANPRSIWLVYWLEKLACRLPDLLVIDTPEYAEYFYDVHGVAPERFRLVAIGADDRLFHPLPAFWRDGTFRVLFYGTFIPLHGVEMVIRAAALLRQRPDIHLDLVGDGPGKARAMRLAEELRLTNVTFHGWIERGRLPEFAARADICLGVFGDTKQGRCTIQNKIYEGLAMAKPVITGDSKTIRATLQHGEHVYLVPREDPEALASAIRRLREDVVLRDKLTTNGHRLFREQFALAAIGQQVATHLAELVDS